MLSETHATPTMNPHGDPNQCTRCHTEGIEKRSPFTVERILYLCSECHNDHSATRERHPVGMRVSESRAAQWSATLPLQEGRLTCLTCHDQASDCQSNHRPSRSRFRLRETGATTPLAFCRNCHTTDEAMPFNVHDQFLETGKPNLETCQWCHPPADDLQTPLATGQKLALRRTATDLCVNCHTMAPDHPANANHVFTTPKTDMLWYMSAFELQARMRLPMDRLRTYVTAAERKPQSIPLDALGRLTCVSCHNPHEKGLFKEDHPRAGGAEPPQASHHRLRFAAGHICLACHPK